MRGLLLGGLLERVHAATLRIGLTEHVLDRRVLARRVDALQHDKQRTLVLRVQTLLQLGDAIRQHRELTLGLHRAVEVVRIRGVVLGELDPLARLDPVARKIGRHV